MTMAYMEMQIRKLPYGIQKKLADQLDMIGPRDWKALISVMPSKMYSLEQVSAFEMQTMRMGGSPSMALLTDLGQRCKTVKQFVVWLKKIGNDAALDILEYHEDVEIIEQPKSQSVLAGGTLTLRCKATGYPAPQYQWVKDGAELSDGIDEELTFDSVTMNDSGKYVCIVSNRLNAEKSNTVELQVLPSPDRELHFRVVYDGKTGSDAQVGTTSAVETPQVPQPTMQELALVPITSHQQQTTVTTAHLRVQIDCESMTRRGPQEEATREHVDSRGLPSAQEVLDFIRFKYFQEFGPHKLEEANSKLQNVQSIDATTNPEDECRSSPVIEPGAQDGDTVCHRLRIDCEAITEPVSQGGATRIIEAPQEPQAVLQGATFVPLTSNQPQIVVATGAQKEAVGNKGLPSAQEALNLIALKYFQEIDPSKSEELNGFIEYLQKVRNVFVVDAQSGSLIITAECSSLQILDDLWNAYCAGHLKEAAQTLVTEDVLEKFGLIEMKLTTTIVEAEYEACREVFLKNSAGDLPTSIMDTVTSEGGEVSGENIKLVCPPGAVDNPLSVKITLEDPSNYFGLIVQKDLENDVMFGAPVICLQPNGFFFKRPVTLTTKFELKNFQCDDVLILHGTEACDGAITWQDITHKSKIDETSEDLIVELEHFSLILVLYRRTLIRTKDIASRLNLLSFDYTLLVLLNKSSPSSAHDELALLFVSQDVYHEQFYKDDETSALMQLKKEGFKELYVHSISGQEEKRICNDEKLQVNIYVGKDYRLANSQHEKIDFNVHSSVWWNAGDVIRCPLEWINPVRSLCGKITVQGEYGHTSKRNFSEGTTDLRGYVRSLLGVKEAIFNLKPLACSLGMPEELMNQVTKSCKDEDEQLNIILQHWSKNTVVAEDLVSLRTVLEGFNQEDYRVTQRGQMHIRHVRKLATKISGLQCINAASLKYFSREVENLCKSVLSDCCIELEGSAEGVERAASSTNHAERLINHFIENNRSIPEDIARKYKRVCSSSEELSTKTFLAIVPHLIQNIKEIFVDYKRTVPHNGLKGLSEEKLNQFVSNVQSAERNNKKGELVYKLCKILELLCLKNDDKQAPTDIEEWSQRLEISRMLILLKPFFQHCMQDVRLQKRLDLFSCRLRDILTDREDIDEVFMHDFSNVLLSLIHFAKFDPSKLVRFELFDSTNTPLTCRRENVKYDKHGNIYSQSFDIRKESEDELQLHAIAYVNIGGRDFYKKGAFQSVIMLNASGEEAFDTCLKRFDVAVMKVEDKSSGNLRLVLCSTQKEKLVEALDALKRELSEDLLDLSQSKITQCHLQMRSIDPTTGADLSFRLVYKWGSEAVTLDSKDFVTFADSTACGSCIPELQLVALNKQRTLVDQQRDCSVAAYGMQIFIKMMNGGKIVLEVKPGDAVKNVKKNIHELKGYPPDQQRLVFSGKRLEDDHTLSDYDVQNGSTLNLVQRLRDVPVDITKRT